MSRDRLGYMRRKATELITFNIFAIRQEQHNTERVCCRRTILPVLSLSDVCMPVSLLITTRKIVMVVDRCRTEWLISKIE